MGDSRLLALSETPEGCSVGACSLGASPSPPRTAKQNDRVGCSGRSSLSDASRPAARSEAIVVQHPTCTMQRNVYHSKLCGGRIESVQRRLGLGVGVDSHARPVERDTGASKRLPPTASNASEGMSYGARLPVTSCARIAYCARAAGVSRRLPPREEEVEAQRTQHTTASEQRVVHLYGAPYAMGTCSAQHAQALRPSLLTAQGFLS